MSDYIYFNGQILPREEVPIPLDERSFRFGDGTFETIRISNQKLYQADLHQNRLNKALSALNIDTNIAILEIASQLLDKQPLDDGFMRVIASRGTGSKGYAPLCKEPNIYAELTERKPPKSTSMTIALSKWRKAPRNVLPAGLKINASGTNVSIALLEAKELGADEALQLDQNGRISECSSGNIFWFTNDTLYTPSLSCDCLDGTTRAAIMRLSPYPVKEITAPFYVLEHAEAVFGTNCNWGVMPITSISPHHWQKPADHSVFETLKSLYQDDITRACS